ncbi:MAG: hypothetical protein DBX60_07435 [Bacillota bacterium]|nr:MAG: hypothetical protein DBX60_07435 [Bacillota bacterium]
MKKLPIALLVPLFALAALTGCGGEDYAEHISDVRSDCFLAETEDFSLTVSCISREVPYAADGVACTRSDLIEIVLKPAADRESENASYSVTLHGTPAVSGELSYRSVKGDYFLSQGVTAFPEGSISLTVVENGTAHEITATSVRTQEMLTPEEAVDFAVRAEQELIGRMTGKRFAGEFQVRLVKRGRAYYYVGIIGKEESAALLLDAETGEVLARRVR